MDCERAFTVLAALAQRREVAIDPGEVESLSSQGLLRGIDPESRRRMESDASAIDGVASRVRNLRRTLDAATSAGGIFRRGEVAAHEASRAELRELEVRLEELTRVKTTADALTWNEPTGTFVQITLAGRRMVSDLAVRRYRLTVASFEDFLDGMGRLRAGLEATVRRAVQILDFIGSAVDSLNLEDMARSPYSTEAFPRFDSAIGASMSSISRPALRVPALILAKQGDDVFRYAAAFNRILAEIRFASVKVEDLLMAGAFLASQPANGDVVQRFERLRHDLESSGLWTGVEVLLAASLIDLEPEPLSEVLRRLNTLHIAGPVVNPLNLVGLARSPYSTEEALHRLDSAKSWIEGFGYKTGEEVAAASAVLASAQQTIALLTQRFSELSGQLRGMFDPPHVAAAMLASNPLEPSESLDLLKEAAGAITRGSFYEGVMEIDGLAMVMLYGQALEAIRLLPESLTPLPGGMSPEAYLYQQGNSWYVWHNYWFYRPTMFYLRTHPLHFHTVPHFG